MMVCACNPSTQLAEARDCTIEASLVHIARCYLGGDWVCVLGM